MDKLIYKNQTVEVQLSGETISGEFKTRIADVQQDRLSIYATTDQGGRMDFPLDKELFLLFIRPDALYSMKTRVLGKLESPLPLLILSRDDTTIQRIQRRKYFRVSVKVKILYRIMMALGGRYSEVRKIAYSRNLSGGGVLLILDEKYQLNDTLIMEIYLPDQNSPVSAAGKIVRMEETKIKGSLCYLTGVEFIDIEETDRDRIMRFLFKVQSRTYK